MNQGNQQLDELIYYTRSQCSEMVSNANLQFTFDLPETIPSITLNWKDCRNIYLLVKEAVNNAIKHAGATAITIKCSVTDQLQFCIADNRFRIRFKKLAIPAAQTASAKAYPNPVEGHTINLQFNNQTKGRYAIRLINTTGETVFSKSIEHPEGSASYNISLPAILSNGMYQLQIIDPLNKKQTQSLVVNYK